MLISYLWVLSLTFKISSAPDQVVQCSARPMGFTVSINILRLSSNDFILGNLAFFLEKTTNKILFEAFRLDFRISYFLVQASLCPVLPVRAYLRSLKKKSFNQENKLNQVDPKAAYHFFLRFRFRKLLRQLAHFQNEFFSN